MKNIIYKLVIACIGLGLLSSCHKLEIENPNGGQNPNFETSVNALGYVYCGQFARISSMFTQQLKGNDIHYQPIYDLYKLSDSKLSASYNIAYRHGISLAIDRAVQYDNIAAGYPATEVNLINESKKKADEGRLIAALIYSVIIEYYKNPEYYQGRDNAPTALSYNEIFALLDEIVTTDYLDEVKLLKTRMLLNQQNYTEALAMINTITDLSAVEYSITFSGSSTNSNEWVRFVGARGGYLSNDSVNIVNNYMVNDPRLPIYYLTDKTFNFPMSRNSINLPLIGALEGYFLMAELKVRANDIAGAEEAYKKGIELSMNWTGVSDFSAYMTANGTLSTTTDDALAQVMKEKYLALFGNPLVFVDYKRTKLPALTEKTSPFPDKWMYFYQ